MFLPAYKGSRNLGDAIQTIALQRFVKCSGYYYRDLWHRITEFKDKMILNGYLCGLPPIKGANTVVAGVHISKSNQSENIEWMRRISSTIGARDPYTYDLFTKSGIKAHMIGCATCLFKRYDGPRKGNLRVDSDRPTMSHQIPTDMPWREQVLLAEKYLDAYRVAQSVITCRLHVAIPCLAFGTPVTITAPRNDIERFTILEDFGVKLNQETIIDMAPFRRRFLRFLETHILSIK